MKIRELWSSKIVALVAVFAAVNVITDSFGGLPTSGVWYSWNFMITSLTGIVLGPLSGFVATFLGVVIGHQIYFQGAFEIIFTVGAPVGATVAALSYRGKWKLVLIYYAVLFSAYFATPVAWQLPWWGMWDTYLAFVVVVAAFFLTKMNQRNLASANKPLRIAATVFAGLEADILFRIFLLIPGKAYSFFYGWDVATLQLIWGSGAVIAPIKVFGAIIATVLIGRPLIGALSKIGFQS